MPHNGGRSVLNLSHPQVGGDFPFINALKSAQLWTLGDSSGAPAPDTLNANGYPTSISNGGVYTIFYIPAASKRSGNWKLRWTGTGTVTVAGGGGAATDGEYTFAPSEDIQAFGNRVVLAITAGTNISSIEFFHVDDEASLDAGGIFTQHYLDSLAHLGAGAFRTLNWQPANDGNTRYWGDRKPLDYVFWAGHELRASIYAGATTNTGNAYSASAPPGWTGLVDKAMVTVKFNATADADDATLNVGSTGDIPIKAPGGNALDTWQGGPQARPTATRFGTLVYDADLNIWMKFGGDGVHYNHFLHNGIPYEAMLALCEEAGAHPYLVRPYLSCDPETDWQSGSASFFRDNMPSWMKLFGEVSPNECWNAAGGFYGTVFAGLKAEDRWGVGTGTVDNWVGMVASEGAQTLETVFSGDRSRYEAIVGVHTHGSTSPDARLESTLYVSEDAGSPASGYITKVAMADYFNDTYTSEQTTQAASDYASGSDAEKAQIAKDFVLSSLVDLGGDQYQFSIPRLKTLVSAFLSWAQGINPDIGLMFYEGGWSPDYTGNAEIDALYAASKSVPDLQRITRQLYFDLLGLGATWLADYRHSGPNAAWSIYDPDIFEEPSPRAEATYLFNRRKRAPLTVIAPPA